MSWLKIHLQQHRKDESINSRFIITLITGATSDGGCFSTECDFAILVSPLLPCVEEWCPWFNEVGVAEGEVPGCDDGVGSNGGLRRLLQYSEQQLQVLVTQRGARRRV